VDGVFMFACRAGDCRFRLGDQWTRDRISGQRDPQLRARVPRERLELCWGEADVEKRIAEFQARLSKLNSGLQAQRFSTGVETAELSDA